MQRLINHITHKLMNHHKPIIIALDGRSGSGKSTIAKQLATQFNATIIMGDDFYSGGNDDEWRSRSPQEKVDLCIDWKRIRDEALKPLLNNQQAIYHPFNFKTGFGLSEDLVKLEPAKVIILDGAYSARPELRDLVDVAVLVEVDDKLRRERLLEREGLAFMQNWHAIWDEAEDYYFTHICPSSKFEFIIKIDNPNPLKSHTI